MSRTGEDLQRLGTLLSASLPAEVAIFRSYEVLWAFEAQPTTESLS